MPNHFHLLLRETTEGGITMFMRKLGTAYTMYFNIKNERTGNLFVKPFRSRHIENDRYLQYVLQYIHFNPAELYEPGWKHGRAENLSRLYTQLTQYPYSSFGDHAGLNKVTRPILDEQIFSVAHQPSPKQMLEDAALFYAECAHQGDTLPA
jgi:hypothetical protein